MFDSFLDFVYENRHPIVAITILAIFLGFLWIKTDQMINYNTKIDNLSIETCSPDEYIHRFESKGHILVVCNTKSGLVVRGIE